MLQSMRSQRVGHDLMAEQQQQQHSTVKKEKLPQPLGHLLGCHLSLHLDRSRPGLSRLHLTSVASSDLSTPFATFPSTLAGELSPDPALILPRPCLLFGLSVVSDSATLWTAACQASLSLTGPVRALQMPFPRKAGGIPEPWLEQSL